MPTANITPLAVREPTIVEVRRIFDLMGGHFDEAKGCYLGGWSDDKVAKELNLPRALVAKVRDEGGLKIKGNPEVIQLKEDLSSVKDMLAEIEGRLAKLEKLSA